jgi:hypothetical protein
MARGGRRREEYRTRQRTRDRMIVDADDSCDERRRDRGEQPHHRKACERGSACGDEDGPCLGGHREPLKTDAPGACRRFGGQQDRGDRKDHQHDVQDEWQLQGVRGVLDQQTGEHGADAEPAHVRRRRDRRTAVTLLGRDGLDDRGGGGTGEDARRQAGEQSADEEHRDVVGDQEYDGARQAGHRTRKQHRTSADGVGPASEHQQRSENRDGVAREDHRRGEHLEVHALGV